MLMGVEESRTRRQGLTGHLAFGEHRLLAAP